MLIKDPATIVSVMALALSLFALLQFYGLRDVLNQAALSDFELLKQQQKQDFMMRFCYDNDIKPCDGVEIEKFNQTLPEEKRFAL